MLGGVPLCLTAAAGTAGAAAWVPCASTPPVWFIISLAIAKPTAISAPMPPTFEPPAAIPCAIWNFTKSFRLPTAAMLERLSMAASTSGGTETFSTTNDVISMPYFAWRIGFSTGSSASPSSL